MKKVLLFLTLIFLCRPVSGQTTATGKVAVATSSTKPATCSSGDLLVTTDDFLLYECGPANTWTSVTSSASSVSFTNITNGTNSTATMTVGTGGSLTFSGSGTINATGVQGITFNPSGCNTGTFFRGDGSCQTPTAAPPAFSAITGGTNTTAGMLVGGSASLGPSGGGIVTANALSGTPAGLLLPTMSSPTTGQNLTNGGASAAWSAPVLDCSQFAGADMSLKIEACLEALYALNTLSGIADADAIQGNQTWSINPFRVAADAGHLPTKGVLKICNTGIMTVNVPIVWGNYWQLDACGTSAGAGDNSNLFQASATTFPVGGRSPGGTITVNSTGNNSTWTGSGTAFTSALIGCAIISPVSQPTGANVDGMIIHSVNVGTQVLTGWDVHSGTGAPGGSDYGIECPLIAQGDGFVGTNPYEFGMAMKGFTSDCNNITGCISLMNWFSDEETVVENFNLKGFTNIGLDRETPYSQNSGPYQNGIIGTSAAGCGSSTIDYVSRSNAGVRSIQHMTVNNSCGTPPGQAFDLQTFGEHVDDVHFEKSNIWINIGGNTSCPVACPMIPKFPRAVDISNIYGASSASSMVHIFNTVNTPSSVVIRNLAIPGGGPTNLLVDDQNSCTIPFSAGNSLVGLYVLGYTGNIQYSTSSVSGCGPQTVFDPSFVLPTASGGNGTASPGITCSGSAVCSGTWPTQNVADTAPSGGGQATFDAALVFASSTTPQYGTISGSLNSTTQANVGWPAPSASTLSSLQVALSADPGNTQTIAVTLYDGVTGESVTCTITGNGTTSKTCSDVSHSFTPAVGDLLTWKVVPSAGISVTINVQITAAWAAPAGTQFFMGGWPATTFSGTQYTSIIGRQATVSGASSNPYLVPRATTFTGMAVTAGNTEGASSTLQFNLVYGVPTTGTFTPTVSAITCTIPNNGSSCSITGQSVVVPSGDWVEIQTVQTSTATASLVGQISVTYQ